MPLEWLVHRQTRQTAEMYGLRDRGLLAPGMRADVNVIDLDGLGVRAPHLVDDLPTGAKRYVRRAEGYGATVCRGTVAVLDDTFTGETQAASFEGRKPILAEAFHGRLARLPTGRPGARRIIVEPDSGGDGRR